MMGPYETEIAWPSNPEDRNSRTHNHHISLRERLKEYQNRTQEFKHSKESEGGIHESTKAAAWAVFQHRGGGGAAGPLPLAHGSAGRGPTRFKIEAQMRHEVAHPTLSETGTTSWDAGSTLFDSFELDLLLKTLDQAANTAGAVPQQTQVEDDEDAGAIVVYSGQKHWLARPKLSPPSQRYGNRNVQSERRTSFASRGALDDGRLPTVEEARPTKSASVNGVQRPVSFALAGNLTLDELFKQGKEEEDSDPFANFSHTPSPFNLMRNARRSFDSSLLEKSGKGGSGRDFNQRSKWKSLLHTLHLDNASGLFNRFQGFHAQVAPHDSHKKLESKAGRRSFVKAEAKSDQTSGSYSPKRSIVSATDDTPFDPRFDPKNLHISKDVHPPAVNDDDHQRSTPAQFWKGGLKAVLSRPFTRPGSTSEKSKGSDSPKRVTSFMSPKSPQKITDGHRVKKKTDHLQSAWATLTTKLQRSHQEPSAAVQEPTRRSRRPQSMVDALSLSHHHEHHHHHHHVPPEAADYELTVQAISQRVSRSSFEEKLAQKFPVEETGGMEAPRSSLAASRTSGDSSTHVERPRLTPWEAESSLSKEAYVY